LRLLYDDVTLVAIDKPSGLLVHRSDMARDGEAALQLVRDAIGAHVYPVHRLDRGASGVLVFAKSPAAARVLHAQLEAGTADKRYLALVRGRLTGERRVDHPVPRGEDTDERVPAVTDVRGVEVTSVDLDGRAQAYSLVEARPHGGRFHQVRRHLKHLGHPIIGDVNYGRGEHNRFCRERFGLARLALHAASLTLVHPDGQPLALHAALPEDLAGPLRRLGFGLA
jgi:tRNA pseudouridine65 synthase